MKIEQERTQKAGEKGLLREEAHTIESILTEEIKCILERNQDERFLRSLLTRAYILEELKK